MDIFFYFSNSQTLLLMWGKIYTGLFPWEILNYLLTLSFDKV
jgi:hypothetical protein